MKYLFSPLNLILSSLIFLTLPDAYARDIDYSSFEKKGEAEFLPLHIKSLEVSENKILNKYEV